MDCEHSQLHLFPNQELYFIVATLFWVLNFSSGTGWQLMIGSSVHFVLVKNLKMQTGIWLQPCPRFPSSGKTNENPKVKNHFLSKLGPSLPIVRAGSGCRTHSSSTFGISLRKTVFVLSQHIKFSVLWLKTSSLVSFGLDECGGTYF